MHKIKGFLLLLLIMTSTQGCSGSSCQGDSEAVAYARSLTQARLEELYNHMKKYHNDPSTPYEGWAIHNKGKFFPAEFADLDVKIVRPKRGNIMVEGCLDQFVYLDFSGLETANEKQAIYLRYNTGKTAYDMASEKLWPK